MGAIHGQGYYDRIGLGEACFSGARGRRRRSDGFAQAASAYAGSRVLQSTSTLSGWVGSVCHGALLGARARRAWARVTGDACAIREGVHQVLQVLAAQIEQLEAAVAKSRSNSWPGTRATPSANAWRAFRASALSSPQPSPPRW